MILDPAHYECPDHGTDLTRLVEEALDDYAPPVAYPRKLSLSTRNRAIQPFQVIVTCPGMAGSQPHRLTCTGTQKR
jgi:hypothetical protein